MFYCSQFEPVRDPRTTDRRVKLSDRSLVPSEGRDFAIEAYRDAFFNSWVVNRDFEAAVPDFVSALSAAEIEAIEGPIREWRS